MPRIPIVGLALFYVPDSAVLLGRAPGAGARGRRVWATDIQQHMPNLPYDQGRRQSPGSEPTQHHWKESRLAANFDYSRKVKSVQNCSRQESARSSTYASRQTAPLPG
jgi:hypothetical protein